MPEKELHDLISRLLFAVEESTENLDMEDTPERTKELIVDARLALAELAS